ncbi:MAG: hypothetical protein C0507_04170 [Cyanobacteria bacterium PR.3.49]|nr:hypothetical protein [Cyanobacteria bacterium PR.3.49]
MNGVFAAVGRVYCQSAFFVADCIFVHVGAEDTPVFIGDSKGNRVGDVNTVVNYEECCRNEKYGNDRTGNAFDRTVSLGPGRRALSNDCFNLGEHGTGQEQKKRHRNKELIAQSVPNVPLLGSKVDQILLTEIDGTNGLVGRHVVGRVRRRRRLQPAQSIGRPHKALGVSQLLEHDVLVIALDQLKLRIRHRITKGFQFVFVDGFIALGRNRRRNAWRHRHWPGKRRS